MEFWRERKVVVTGGAGVIGSYLAEELVRHQAEVTVLDNLEAGRLENLAAIRDRITFVQGDVADIDFCREQFCGQTRS